MYAAERWDSIEDRWYVRVGDERVIGLGQGAETLTEWEARAIAFTLTALSRGEDVYSRPRVWHGEVPRGEAQFTRYDGPEPHRHAEYKCRFPGCDRYARGGWTTCPRHYTAGRSQSQARRHS